MTQPQQSIKNYLDPQTVAALESLSLRARMVVEGFISGLHKSPYHGFNVEFAEHRAYEPGDDIRHIDWKTYARTDKYYVKLYEEETNMRIYLLLDISASMGFQKQGTVNKLEYAKCLAASLAYLILKQRDAVGLGFLGEGLKHYIPPRAQSSHLQYIIRSLETYAPLGLTNLNRSLLETAERIKRRGLIIVISDLWDDAEALIKGLVNLRHMKNEVSVFHVMDAQELSFNYDGLVKLIDLEDNRELELQADEIRPRYQQKVREFIATLQGICGEHQIDYALMNTSEPYSTALSRYLTARRR